MAHSTFSRWTKVGVKIALLAICPLFPLSVNAQTIESIDTGPNDTFSDRVTVSSGANRIYGELTPVDLGVPDYKVENVLEAGSVDEVQLTDLPPGAAFFAWVTMENIDMDPIMGLFDDQGNLIRWDDDSSPTASLAPAIRDTISEDGTLTLKVSGVGDDDFDGNQIYYYGDNWDSEDSDDSSAVTEPHYQAGEYTLSVITNAVDIKGDVDFFTLSGLTPGHRFAVSESMSEGGVRLGWIAEDGTVASVSSYSDVTYCEQLEGIVPATGQLHIAVSGYDDSSFEGQHTNSGEYVLRVDIQPLD